VDPLQSSHSSHLAITVAELRHKRQAPEDAVPMAAAEDARLVVLPSCGDSG